MRGSSYNRVITHPNRLGFSHRCIGKSCQVLGHFSRAHGTNPVLPTVGGWFKCVVRRVSISSKMKTRGVDYCERVRLCNLVAGNTARARRFHRKSASGKQSWRFCARAIRIMRNSLALQLSELSQKASFMGVGQLLLLTHWPGRVRRRRAATVINL